MQNKVASRMLRASAKLLLVSGLLLILTMASINAATVPEGMNVSTKRIENATPETATIITTAGGTVTTIILNGTTQTPNWKAYVGNVTGRLTLRDAGGLNIYDWSIATAQGEVYATRKSTTVDWTNIGCANITHIENEQTALDYTALMPDRILNTFTRSTHKEFYTSLTHFAVNQCHYATSTYVNNTAQTAYFQEVVLYDGTTKTNGGLVYSTMIEANKVGFDYGTYDFQLLVPENASAEAASSMPYYFYMELI
jgi:hypothetical protein